ncbi:N-acetylmuramoyl-L-alanine amidase [Sphingobacterium deserti]|uniref:N-acetylmuramoyl-L-alanine amidase n=1 Tax=Sphingobacterium deserti TaxID=1229276 RepID=A0A0B8T197_9SPHI|nr:N-acetylmuramoyl-L-alanine amidase [Sphingobacterium deserti]KGE14612.1 cell wall hydrolase/autolysin [Sphingobacterium deserti]
MALLLIDDSYISAGHHNSDPGAMANGLRESVMMMEYRDMVSNELFALGATVVNDRDTETLGQYLARINPKGKDVLCEFHADAAGPTATGATGVIADAHTAQDKAFATEMVKATSDVLGIRNRGVIKESQSARGRLAFVRKGGINSLQELFFITNPSDVVAYERGKSALAKEHARIINKYDGGNSTTGNVSTMRTTARLNLRAGAGIGHRVIRTLPLGIEVNVLSISVGWIEVLVCRDKVRGWVSASYLK